MHDARTEIAARAARLVVEQGLDYASAKRRAARGRGTSERAMLPDNHELENAVREYLDLFHASTQPATLRALRRLALQWMTRLIEFRPHLCGPVWQGTATENSPIQIELFCNDPKLAEISMLNMGFRPFLGGRINGKDETNKAVYVDKCDDLMRNVDIFVSINDYDLIRGGLRADRYGRVRRGDLSHVQRKVQEAAVGQG